MYFGSLNLVIEALWPEYVQYIEQDILLLKNNLSVLSGGQITQQQHSF